MSRTSGVKRNLNESVDDDPTIKKVYFFFLGINLNNFNLKVF